MTSPKDTSNKESKIIHIKLSTGNIIIGGAVLYLGFSAISSFFNNEVEWHEFESDLNDGHVRHIKQIGEDEIKVDYTEGEDERTYTTHIPQGANLWELIQSYNETLPQENGETNPVTLGAGGRGNAEGAWLIVATLATALIGGGIFLFGSGIKQLAKSATGAGQAINSDDYEPIKSDVTFREVAGIEETKEELEDIVEYLKNPKKFSSLGGKVPKGVLMEGPPGTGKTLLAKAVAGEAGVNFLSLSGSDFVELFVGNGARKVRNLFKHARKHAPCIVFIDEVDAVGEKRENAAGGNSERKQTINALLKEMDGIVNDDKKDKKSGSNEVIVIAATNRRDSLDSALTRPGRFDRVVSVPLPDVKGREAILKVHARKIKMDVGVNLQEIAQGTRGFSGADLANMLNEAALIGAKRDANAVTMELISEARDKVIMGPQLKSRVVDPQDKLETCYHEAGHAVLAYKLKHADQVEKVTVVPRGQSAGVTMMLPNKDYTNYSYNQMLDKMAVLAGGRAAEVLQFSQGQASTGASMDIKMMSTLANNMVRIYGMSETLGMLLSAAGMDGSLVDHMSDDQKNIVFRETLKFVRDAEKRAVDVLTENWHLVGSLAQELYHKETVHKDEFLDLMSAHENDERIKPAHQYNFADLETLFPKTAPKPA